MTTLQLLRLKKGLSQKELAVELQIHPSTYNQVEKGWFSRPPSGIEPKLQAVFGKCWTWELFMQSPPEPRPDGA